MNYNGCICKYRLYNGKVGQGKIVEGKRYRYIMSENGPIKMESVKGLRFVEDGDPLSTAIQADLDTYDKNKINQLGDKKNETIEDMAKLFLLNHDEYRKDAQKNGQAYTKAALEEFSNLTPEEQAERDKLNNDLDPNRNDDNQGDNDNPIDESYGKNAFINSLRKQYSNDKIAHYTEDAKEEEEFTYDDDNTYGDSIADFDTNDIYSSIDNEESGDYDYDEEDDDNYDAIEDEGVETLDSTETIKLPDGSLIDISDLIEKIKMDVEGKIEDILDELESSEDDSFSDEKLIDELSEVFKIDGKSVLKEIGNIPDTVLKISEIARANVLESYKKSR